MFRRFVVLCAVTGVLAIGFAAPPVRAQSCATMIAAGDTAALIAAITCANITAGSQTIALTPSTYTLTTPAEELLGLPSIVAESGSLTINGNGAIIERSAADGTPLFRLVQVNSGAILTLNHLTLRRGNVGTGVGGAIVNRGALTLNGVTISDSSAREAGALFANGGTAILRDSTLNGNTARTFGGAILNSSALWIINSTLSGNQTTDTAGTSGGGAIDSFSGAVRIINSTIAFNTSPGPNAARSGIFMEGGSLTLHNSIISNNNGANNCAFTGGTLAEGITNIENGSSCGLDLANVVNVDPQILPLADNGGPTRTHAIALTSMAHNRGLTALAVDQHGAALAGDQRGESLFPRVVGPQVDMGAYELSGAILTLTLTQQGRGAPPSAAHASSVNVQVRSFIGLPVLTLNGTSTPSGTFDVRGLSIGTYNVRVKTPTALAVINTITVNADSVSLTTSVLREGDADNNNVVNINDFSILAASFGRASGQAGFDGRADFNQDGVVTVADFSLLAASFGQVGAP